MLPVYPLYLAVAAIAAFAARCGKNPFSTDRIEDDPPAGRPDASARTGSKDAGSDDTGPNPVAVDAGAEEGGVTDAGEEDAGGTDAGGTDAGETLPQREGVEERWAAFDTALIDMDSDARNNGLSVLLAAGLQWCPTAQGLAKSACKEIVSFDNDFVPAAHTDLGDNYSVVTGDRDGEALFLVIHRAGAADRRLRASMPVSPGRHLSGQGNVDLLFRSPSGALLLGGELLVASGNATSPGTLSRFLWNGDGTVSTMLRTGQSPQFLNTSANEPTLFIPKDETSAWILNNRPALGRVSPEERGSTPRDVPAGLDYLTSVAVDGGRLADTDPSQRIALGTPQEGPVNPLKNLGVRPDNGAVLLARGADVFVVSLENGAVSEALELPAPVVSLPWHAEEGLNRAFAADAERHIYSVSIEQNRPTRSRGPLDVFGDNAASVIGVSGGCFLYQGVLLEGGGSAITAIACDVLKNL